MEIEYIIAAVVILALVVYQAKKSKDKGSKGYRLGDRVRSSLWFHIGNLGGNFNDKNGKPVPNDMIRHWLDVTKETGLNGVTLRVEGWLVNDDGSIDQHLANRVTWFLNECNARGLVVSLGVGSAWGRKRGTRNVVELRDQHLNWWDNKGPITPYLQYVGKHWGSRPNVICTFNEMDRGGSSKAWKKQANHYYNVLRQAGAKYIGTSEHTAWTGEEDLLLVHNQRAFKHRAKPWGVDEAAGGDDLYKDSAMRDPSRINEYRAYFNKAAKNGASWIGAGSWVNRHKPADAAVKTVFRELAKR